MRPTLSCANAEGGGSAHVSLPASRSGRPAAKLRQRSFGYHREMGSRRIHCGLVLGLWLALHTPPVIWADETPGRYPQASTRILTEAELSGESAETLSNMRNEVFARHGHRFQTPRLHKLFSAQSWYSPTTDDASAALTELERKNVALIRSVEKRVKAAAQAKAEAEQKAAWAKLPPDVQVFWTGFRTAVRSGDGNHIARFVTVPFRNGLDPVVVRETPFGSEYRSTRLSQAEFVQQASAMLPSFVVLQMLKKSPDPKGKLLYFYSDPEDDDNAEERVGRIYRFRLRGNSYRLEGVWLAAGPGEFD